MAKTIHARVSEAFKDSSHEDVTKYLEWLRANMETLSQNVRRTLVLALILIAAFELVSGSSNTVIAIGSFRLSNGSIVMIFIPAIVSFLLYQAMADSNQLGALQMAFAEVFVIWSSTAARNELNRWVLPSQPIYWNVTYAQSSVRVNWQSGLQSVLEGIMLAVVLVAIITFQVQAYLTLHTAASQHITLWFISLFVAVFCSIATLLQFIGVLVSL